jgi:hypothetical protein
MDGTGCDRLEDIAVRELNAGMAKDAVVPKLMTDEEISLYEANFIIAAAIQRNNQKQVNMDALRAFGVTWYRDPYMVILPLSVLAVIFYLLS